MALNLDRIRALAAEDDDTIPPLTDDAAQSIVRLLGAEPDRAQTA